MSDFLIIEDDQGLIVGKQKYIGDIDVNDVMNGNRFTTKIKNYGNGYFKFYTSNVEMFGASVPKNAKPKKSSGIEDPEGSSLEIGDTVSDEPDRDRRKDVIRRSVEAIHDIILLNEDLTWFFSMTINPSDFDSRDASLVAKKVSKWLYNQVTRRGLKFVTVAEYHPQKGDHKIHFHGLINDAFE